MDDDEDGVIKGASNAGRDDEELRDDEIAELDCDDSSGSDSDSSNNEKVKQPWR